MRRLLAALVVGCAATIAAADDNRVHVSVEGRYRVGNVEGQLQTGNGGAPGTTSPGRPTLSEIGVQLAHEPGVEVKVAWRAHELLADANFLFLYGGTTLGEDLTSQGQAFPANTDVDSKTWLLTGRAAYRHRFNLKLGSETLGVRPGLGAAGFRFQYALEGSNGAETDRSYGHIAPHLELGLSWRPGGCGRVWFSGHAYKTLEGLMPESNQTDVFEAVLGVNYDIDSHLSLRLETGFRRFRFHDDQDVPNDIDVDFGPWLGIGLSLRF